MTNTTVHVLVAYKEVSCCWMNTKVTNLCRLADKVVYVIHWPWIGVLLTYYGIYTFNL